jgi:uncharacterized membrane protein
MNFSRKVFILSLVAGIVLLASTAAFAKLPVRRSSQNGEDSNAAFWNLLSVSQPLNLAANGKKVVVTRQVICVNQDVENAQASPNLSRTGTCDSGLYMHVFQLKSTAANVTVTLGQLIGFVADPNAPNYGVLVCDSAANTLELCINDTNPNDVPNITFSVAKNKTAVSFVIPNFPAFPAGTGNQGQGMTIFVLLQQPHALPIQFPKVAIR